MSKLQKKNVTALLTDDDLAMLETMMTDMGVTASTVLRLGIRYLHFIRAGRLAGYLFSMKRGLKDKEVPILDDIPTPLDRKYREYQAREVEKAAKKKTSAKKASSKTTKKAA